MPRGRPKKSGATPVTEGVRPVEIKPLIPVPKLTEVYNENFILKHQNTILAVSGVLLIMSIIFGYLKNSTLNIIIGYTGLGILLFSLILNIFVKDSKVQE